VAKDIFDVEGKVAFVTGAGSGLGRAISEAMAEGGARVALFDIDGKGLAETSLKLKSLPSEFISIEGDVSDEAAVDAAVAETQRTFGRFDILFNNAGIGDPAPGILHEYDTSNWNKVISVNLQGAFYCARAALRLMVAQGSGKIINTASMWGLAGASSVFPLPAYNATKGAIVNLTRELALQYAEKNIQVNAICPGFFRTKLGPFDDEAFVAAVTNFTPMKRIAEPDEIKGTALYLASSASNFVTGAMLVIDGGCMAK
jgi:NAD(P)-dependent dehydrogenase (short-subunit alcohol dehydrogenase family)